MMSGSYRPRTYGVITVRPDKISLDEAKSREEADPGKMVDHIDDVLRDYEAGGDQTSHPAKQIGDAALRDVPHPGEEV